jgi:DNA-directed RNA polymerase subunit H
LKKRKTKEAKVLRIEHALIPKHEIMKEEEVDELLKNYNITKENLPKIKIYDPAISHLNPKVGDVIRIYRQDEKVFYYRVVVE